MEHLLHPSISFPTVIEGIRRLSMSQILQLLLPNVALEAFKVCTFSRVRRAIHAKQLISTFAIRGSLFHIWLKTRRHCIHTVVLWVITTHTRHVRLLPAGEEFLKAPVLLNRLNDVGFLGIRASVPLVRKMINAFIDYMWLEEA